MDRTGIRRLNGSKGLMVIQPLAGITNSLILACATPVGQLASKLIKHKQVNILVHHVSTDDAHPVMTQ